jgi:MFS family permease
MGFWADRLGAARVLAAGFALWSLATVGTGFSRGLPSLLSLRVGMGVGESVTYPSALALLAQRVSDRSRAFATAVLQLGGVLGPACGTFFGGLLMLRYGWRAMFIVMGLLSLLWLIPWSRQLRSTPHTSAVEARPGGPTYRQILRQRALWGAMAGGFCSNYAFYFVFTWLPSYLVQERGLSLLAMTHLTSAIYLVDGISVLSCGWLLDAWVRRGATVNIAYKSALVIGATGVGVSLLAASGAGPAAAGALLLFTGAMDGVINPALCALTQHFAGPQASGRWMGLQNAVANLAGIVAPPITGHLVQASGHYTAALWLAGGVSLCGVIGWLLLVPPVRPVQWATQ